MARAWKLHAAVAAAVLCVSLVGLRQSNPGGLAFFLGIAFAWAPFAVVYTALSTLAVATLRPGRRWVAVAHAGTLALAVLVPLLWSRGSS